MALSTELRTALERGRSRLLSPNQHSRNGPTQAAEHGHGAKELARQTRAASQTGPLVLGPSRSSSKDSWRDDARFLEELYPEDFGPPRNQPSSAPCVESSLCSGLVDSASRKETQCPPGDPESSQSAPQSVSAPPPIPELAPLPAAFWRALLYGSPDALLATAEATLATRLVAQALGVPSVDLPEFTESIRAGQFRRGLRESFGDAQAEQAMAALWRNAPASPGSPQPNEDESRLTPGVRDCPRTMPAWRRGFHLEVCNEQRLLEGIGGWSGG
jgi:hypothetical protein